MIILKVFKQSLIIRNKKHTALRNALYKNNKNKSQPGNQCTEPMLFHTENKMMMMEKLKKQRISQKHHHEQAIFFTLRSQKPLTVVYEEKGENRIVY